MTTGFRYDDVVVPDQVDVEEALHAAVECCMGRQLGWPRNRWEAKAASEVSRTIPKSIFDRLESRGWKVPGAKILDVGAGKGGALLELLVRGSDAYGIEPAEELVRLVKARIVDEGFDPTRIMSGNGENLPYRDKSFDYTISLQVLEHVPDPLPVMREMYRVLKPGGRCYISCENYLSFQEQHYRVFWLPMLPKKIGASYLHIRGRNPEFLINHVYYTTYPKLWRIIKQVGFVNETYTRFPIASAGPKVPDALLRWGGHIVNVLRPGIRMHLKKPR